MSQMRFEVTERESLPGSVIYRCDEDSFEFDEASPDLLMQRAGDAGVTSLIVEYLRIDVAVEGGVGLFVWGYHPRSIWTTGVAAPARLRPGSVSAAADGVFTPGVSERLVEAGEWNTVFDSQSGWVRVTADLNSQDDQIVEIADQTGLGLIGDQLNSIWLRPTFVP